MNQLDLYMNELPAWIADSQHLQDPTFVTLEMGAYLFKQGEASTSAYIILAGGLAVVRREENNALIEIDKLFSGDIVGEMGLISGQVRTASVQAIVPTRLLEISAEDFATLQRENDQIGNQLLRYGSDRWQRLQFSSILANIFGELDASAVHDLQNRLNWRNLSAGD
ncbi:MAG: cyclic nucleotide-binding domain-containing protein, partial [Chloroflexota bacterium]